MDEPVIEKISPDGPETIQAYDDADESSLEESGGSNDSDVSCMECEHNNVNNMDGNSVCIDCGLKLDESLLYNENRYYGVDDTRFTKNPSRYHKRKDEERTLYADLEPLGFPHSIIEKANDYYKIIIKNKIYRARNRLAIVFACTFYAYIDCNEPQSAPELAKKFNLDKKGISGGIKTFSNNFKHRPDKKHIQPLDLIPKLLSILGITDPTYLKDIEKIYQYAEDKSPLIKKSVPQSVAAGMVYLYLKYKHHPITKAEFAKTVNLTEITFTKIAQEASELIGKKIKC